MAKSEDVGFIEQGLPLIPAVKVAIREHEGVGANLFPKCTVLIDRGVDNRLSKRGRISLAHTRSTISSWVKTEYAGDPVLHMSIVRRSTPARMVSRRHRLVLAPGHVDEKRTVQIRPRSRRMMTTKRISPSPPVG